MLLRSIRFSAETLLQSHTVAIGSCCEKYLG